MHFILSRYSNCYKKIMFHFLGYVFVGYWQFDAIRWYFTGGWFMQRYLVCILFPNQCTELLINNKTKIDWKLRLSHKGNRFGLVWITTLIELTNGLKFPFQMVKSQCLGISCLIPILQRNLEFEVVLCHFLMSNQMF